MKLERGCKMDKQILKNNISLENTEFLESIDNLIPNNLGKMFDNEGTDIVIIDFENKGDSENE
jgi:hypothetical protein